MRDIQKCALFITDNLTRKFRIPPSVGYGLEMLFISNVEEDFAAILMDDVAVQRLFVVSGWLKDDNTDSFGGLEGSVLV